jgi:hypothetical protein
MGGALLVVWALLSDEEAQFVDLGPDYYDSRTNPNARSASTFGDSRPSGTRSPSTPHPDRGSRIFRIGGPLEQPPG